MSFLTPPIKITECGYALSVLAVVVESQSGRRLIFAPVADAGNNQNQQRGNVGNHLEQLFLRQCQSVHILRQIVQRTEQKCAGDCRLGRQITKITSATASQPRSPNALFDQEPPM